MNARVTPGRNVRSRAAWAVLLLLLACAAACGLSACIQGGGTDVGNALVQGQVTDRGVAVSGARVMLMPEAYNPVLGDPTGQARVVTADAEGRYKIAGVKPGRYALETRHPEGDRMDWIRDVVLDAGEALTESSSMDTARTLKVRIPDSAAADAFVFIPGSDVKAAREPGDTSGIIRLIHAPSTAIPVLGLARLLAPGAVTSFTVNALASDTLVSLKSP